MAERKDLPIMSTVDTTAMTIDEIRDAVSNGDITPDEVTLTDEQLTEVENELSLSIAELRGAFSVLLADDDELANDAADAMVASVLRVITEHRQMVAFMDTLFAGLGDLDGEDDVLAALFG
jgi:hypothetical protein